MVPTMVDTIFMGTSTFFLSDSPPILVDCHSYVITRFSGILTKLRVENPPLSLYGAPSQTEIRATL